MATLAPPRQGSPPAPVPPGGGPGAGWGKEGSGGGPASSLPERRYYTGLFVGLSAIVMLFAAFTSAYVVRQGISDDWRPLVLPFTVWPSTLVLLASSWTLTRALSMYEKLPAFRFWWLLSVALGLIFLLGQLLTWSRLAASGIFLESNPSSSFFYVLTAAHGVHLAGGIAALLWVLYRSGRGSSRRPGITAARVSALYWHFMDGLWIYLLALLLVWR